MKLYWKFYNKIVQSNSCENITLRCVHYRIISQLFKTWPAENVSNYIKQSINKQCFVGTKFNILECMVVSCGSKIGNCQ